VHGSRYEGRPRSPLRPLFPPVHGAVFRLHMNTLPGQQSESEVRRVEEHSSRYSSCFQVFCVCSQRHVMIRQDKQKKKNIYIY
jgi:hypothetical protein